MATKALPAEFRALTPWTERWGQADEVGRNRARVTSELADIEAFYHAMMPHMDDILGFLGDYDDSAAEPVLNLAHLAKSFVEASLCVELFHSPTVPDGFDYRRFRIFSPT